MSPAVKALYYYTVTMADRRTTSQKTQGIEAMLFLCWARTMGQHKDSISSMSRVCWVWACEVLPRILGPRIHVVVHSLVLDVQHVCPQGRKHESRVETSFSGVLAVWISDRT